MARIPQGELPAHPVGLLIQGRDRHPEARGLDRRRAERLVGQRELRLACLEQAMTSGELGPFGEAKTMFGLQSARQGPNPSRPLGRIGFEGHGGWRRSRGQRLLSGGERGLRQSDRIGERLAFPLGDAQRPTLAPQRFRGVVHPQVDGLFGGHGRGGTTFGEAVRVEQCRHRAHHPPSLGLRLPPARFDVLAFCARRFELGEAPVQPFDFGEQPTLGRLGSGADEVDPPVGCPAHGQLVSARVVGAQGTGELRVQAKNLCAGVAQVDELRGTRRRPPERRDVGQRG